MGADAGLGGAGRFDPGVDGFRELLDQLPMPVWVTDPKGHVEWVNAAAAVSSGWPVQTVTGDRFAAVHPDDRVAVRAFLGHALGAGEPFETECRALSANREYHWIVVRAAPVRDAKGRIARWVAVVADVDEQRRAVTAVETMFLEAPVALSFVDREFRVVRVNKAASALFGVAEHLISRRLPELMPNSWPLVEEFYRRVLDRGEAIANVELEGPAPARPGETRYWLMDFYPVRVRDEVVGVGSVAVDVSERKRAEIRLRHLADHDPLTGVYNRRRLIEELDRQLRRAARSGRAGAVLVFDVDHLKFVNDTYGHAAGDAMIKAVAETIQARIRETDVVARQGGDEFTLILPETAEDEALLVARDIRASLLEREMVPQITTSAGVALFTGEREITADEILVCADTALYEAKELGGGHVRVYARQASGALTWVQRIRTALSDDRLALYGQPIVELRTGSIVCRELLVRMLSDDGEIILPAMFIPTAERFGLIREIDRWVTGAGLRVARSGEPVAINLSGHSIGEEPIIALVRAAIADGLNPADLSFEITEMAAMTNLTTARSFVGTLAGLGCTVALDDFGTGFGSFSYLKHIPARYLKIDIEFVRDLTPTRPTSRSSRRSSGSPIASTSSRSPRASKRRNPRPPAHVRRRLRPGLPSRKTRTRLSTYLLSMIIALVVALALIPILH